MIRTLRILFLGRPTREKFLVLALVVLIAVWWLSGFAGRLSRFISEARHTSVELRDQHMWLANRERIEREAQAEARQLDPSRTLDGPRLTTEMANMASEHDLTNFHTSDTDDTQGGQFVIHSLQFNIAGASWENLEAFYSDVESHAPYISVESFSIASNRANPAQLNASLRVSSVEIRH